MGDRAPAYHQLAAQGISNVAELVVTDAKSLRSVCYGVVVGRTVQELQGRPNANLEPMTQAKQQIISSRSFGERITEFGPMREVLASYMERAEGGVPATTDA